VADDADHPVIDESRAPAGRATTDRRALHVLGACGITLLAAFLALIRCGQCDGNWVFLALLGTAAVAYAIAMAALARLVSLSRAILFSCLILAAGWRLPLMLSSTGLQTDIYRYLWDGRLQHLGYSPYAVVPADPAFDRLHTPATRLLNNPSVASPYPPAAQLFFRLVTSAGESVGVMKGAVVLCDAATVALIWFWLASTGRDPKWTLAYAWNPLVILEGARDGHVDLLGVACLMMSVLALSRRRTLLASIALVVAVEVKFLPVVLVPLYWKRVRVRDALVAGAVGLALYLPFGLSGGIPAGSVAEVVHRFRFNNPLFELLERPWGPWLPSMLAVVLGLLVAVWARWRLAVDCPAAWAWPMAAALLLAPMIYPWYLVWLSPFLFASATLPLLLWTLTILSTYRVWFIAVGGARWAVPAWSLVLQYGAMAVAVAWLHWIRAGRRPRLTPAVPR
jgi:alpha-1,6-mannosyltransferase